MPYQKPVTILFESTKQRDLVNDLQENEDLYFPWECFVLSSAMTKIPNVSEKMLIDGRIWMFSLLEFPNAVKFAYAGLSAKSKPQLVLDKNTFEFKAAFIKDRDTQTEDTGNAEDKLI